MRSFPSRCVEKLQEIMHQMKLILIRFILDALTPPPTKRRNLKGLDRSKGSLKNQLVKQKHL